MRISLRTKVIVAVLLMAVVVAGVAGAISYSVYSRTMEEHYERLTVNTASSAASMVDAQAVAELAERTVEIYRSLCPAPDTPPDFASFDEADWEAYYGAFAEITASPAYQQAFDTLSALKEDNEVLWMYVAFMDEQTGQGIYIIDADATEDACPPGTCGDIEPENLALIRQGIYDFPPYITNYEEFGWLSSAAAAITDDQGNVVANAFVDFSMNEVMADREDFLLRLVAILAAVTLGLILALAYAFSRAVVRPINQLAQATGSFVSDKQQDRDSSAISRLNIRTGDELEKLSSSICQMEREINSYITDLTRVTAERERIGAELDVARNIQASMLPCIFPPFPQREEFSIFAAMDPAKEVGGDFYDFFLVDDDHLALVMADVSGKGVPAAMFMVIAKTLLKNAAQTGMSPKAVLEKVNDQLCENNDAEMFVTVWLGILEISTGRLICANAGHEYPAIRRAGGEFELFRDRHGFVLAGMEHARYREYELDLSGGDMLFVYTDGVAEATDSQEQLYGTDRMLAALNRCRNVGCEELLRDVRADIDAFVGEAPQFDDITMLALELKDLGRGRMSKINLRPELECIGQATAFFEETLAGHGAPARVIAQVNVVVDEIFSNIARYSGATSVTLGCETEEGFVRLRFSDNGRPYDPTQKPDPDTTLPLEERGEGGMGVFLVKQITDAITYHYSDGFNVLTLEKRW
ncbi:ATP-binding SpoIIE family protein phosphatase [uncultured Flavonifractor sp.]|uniref:ATP-binding SpoIIE family protein phosphatase n=1 Tax=uncultured Flavonifractor sp. TaxID=1193534 RepID=UPI00260688D7|nr:SpoIIE family protein phosphatase [uncultured Flavonifractor sp.]